jgi:hypothetical protein
VRVSLERIARAWWPVIAGAALGLVAGGFWTLAQPDRYRAEARVLVRGPSGVVPAVRTLAESSILEQNVAQTLRLSRPPEVSAEAGEGGVVTVSVEAESRERARQIDAEAALVLTQLAAARFRATPRTTVTVLDPAHAVEQTSPTPARNYLIAGLIGLGTGAAAAAALAYRRRLPLIGAGADPGAERRLRARIDEVAKRERALAKRAGEFAARERELARRDHELGARERALAAQAPIPAGPAAADATVVSEAAIAPKPEIGGAMQIERLEELVRTHRDAFPDHAEEWDAYVFHLRAHAHTDGRLPPNFEPLVQEVFAPLLERSGEPEE